ncbi:Uncharacterized protein BP5553_03048 [Venustampulla echinocandica]|uniref:Branched-chain amino acid aminotransferase II n=1 Tax=Venustampulla echinocandica TaxID=2656787 RepID=A0A370TT93_9HELO|nr:Uncharacterized protein BP5553_03048 [Venustampulla echinocandica]RDL38708.1 Uncharacterized protein BP5553_03048 [Venustampulla echinocandica]
MSYIESQFPPPPLENINWAALGSAITEDNGHVECRYDVTTGVWTEPTLIKDPYIKVHGLAPGLNYGQQAYEGMKAYRSPTNTINVFRPQYHATRLANSSSCVSIPPIPEKLYLDAVNLAVARNAAYVPPHSASALLYIRPVVFGSAGNLGLTPPSEYTFAVYTQPGNAYHGIKPMPAVVMEEFDRSAPRGTGGYKVGGNYAPCIRWQGKARQMGYGLTLHLDSKTQSELEEFSTSGFVGVRREGDGKTTLCIPDSTNIVDSVTSDAIVAIAKSLGWTVEKRKIHYTELRYLTEVLAVGTAASIVPVASIHRPSTDETFVFNHSGEGSAENPGPVCVQLSHILLDIQKGVVEDSWGWRSEVTDPDAVVNGSEPTKEVQEVNGKHEKEVPEVNGKEPAKETQEVN